MSAAIFSVYRRLAGGYRIIVWEWRLARASEIERRGVGGALEEWDLRRRASAIDTRDSSTGVNLPFYTRRDHRLDRKQVLSPESPALRQTQSHPARPIQRR